MRVLIAILALALSTPPLAAAAEPLELRVFPRTCASPCTIRVIVRAEPDDANRALVLELDSPGYFRSSVITLDGNRAALIHERDFQSLMRGNYVVRVTLLGTGQQRAQRRNSVRVVGE